MNEHISDAVIRRLPGYYRHLRELEKEEHNCRNEDQKSRKPGQQIFQNRSAQFVFASGCHYSTTSSFVRILTMKKPAIAMKINMMELIVVPSA